MKSKLTIFYAFSILLFATCSRAPIPLNFEIAEWLPESGQLALGESIQIHYLCTEDIPEGVLAEARIFPEPYTLDSYEIEVTEGRLIEPEKGIESWIEFQKTENGQSLKLAIRPTCIGSHRIILGTHAFENPAGFYTYARTNQLEPHDFTVVE